MSYILEYADHSLPLLAEELAKIFGKASVEDARKTVQAINRIERIAEDKRFEWAAAQVAAAGIAFEAEPLEWTSFHTSEKLRSRTADAGEPIGDGSDKHTGYFAAVRGTGLDYELDLQFNKGWDDYDRLIHAKIENGKAEVELPQSWKTKSPMYLGMVSDQYDVEANLIFLRLEEVRDDPELLLDVLCDCAQRDWNKRAAAYRR